MTCHGHDNGPESKHGQAGTALDATLRSNFVAGLRPAEFDQRMKWCAVSGVGVLARRLFRVIIYILTLNVRWSVAFSPSVVLISGRNEGLHKTFRNFARTTCVNSHVFASLPEISKKITPPVNSSQTIKPSRRSVVTGTLSLLALKPSWAEEVTLGTPKSKTLPVEFNELDPEAASILQQDSVSPSTVSDNVFVFRDQKLLKTNREGALRYFARFQQVSSIPWLALLVICSFGLCRSSSVYGRRNAVFLGESHSSAPDKLLALRIIRDLHVRWNMTPDDDCYLQAYL